MSALLETPFTTSAHGWSKPPSPTSGAGAGPLTTGLAEVFGDMAPSFHREPVRPVAPTSTPMVPFGAQPLRMSAAQQAQYEQQYYMQQQQMQPPMMPQYQQAQQPVHQDPAFRPPTQPLAPTNPPTGSLAGVSATALMSALEQQHQPPTTDAQVSLETLRMQMFGRYHEELEGRMKELRAVVDGSLARGRRGLQERMDELGSALHRDMVAMRQEMQKELEDLKRDVFSAVMSISALNDKLGMTDSRFKETWMAVTKALTDRIDSQAAGMAISMKSLEAKTDFAMEEKVGAMVEQKLIRLATERRAQQAAAANRSPEAA